MRATWEEQQPRRIGAGRSMVTIRTYPNLQKLAGQLSTISFRVVREPTRIGPAVVLSANTGSLQLSLGHAETETIAVWISHRKFTKSPRLINWSSMNWRLRTFCRVQTPGAKGHVTLINVIDKHTVDGAEGTVSCMT